MSGLYTKLVSSVLFPIHERLKKHTTVAVRHQMETLQWRTYAELKSHQVNRLRAFLTEIGRSVPYYRRQFSQLGFDPGAVQDLSALQQLPFLTKDLIREHELDLKSDDAEGLAQFNTGGSSGQPLVFYIGRQRVSHDVAAKWRATRWWGVDIGDPELVVWGSPIELGSQDRVRAIRDWFLRTDLLSAFEMSDDKLDEFVARIRQQRPRMLFGYPSALAHIAAHARKRGQCMDDLGIRVAFVTSERLYDEQRDTIESVFGCPVANGYGGRDAGFIAHQCPDGGMHLTADDIIVEIIGTDGQPVASGESGEVVVTHLYTDDFPFVRYRTGDVAVLDSKQCSCGRCLPLIRQIHGRTTDFVVASDGTVMHGLALIYILRELAGIEGFKIIQEDRHHTRVLIVRGADFEDGSLAVIEQGIKTRLGQDVRVTVEITDRIASEASGKFRYVVSHVEAS